MSWRANLTIELGCRFVSKLNTQIIQYSRADLVNHIGRDAKFLGNIRRLTLLDDVFSKDRDVLLIKTCCFG
ncbi:MAG: hypothetical protein MK106_01725 [Mariniblastus sp.]|nr:hypothetical protein [Mariniblastus sp.]